MMDFTKHRSIGLLLLRLAVASIFIFHGMQKWPILMGTVPEGMPAWMITVFKLLAVCEPLAGLALILGLLVPIASAGLCIVMISALYMKLSNGQGFAVYELDLILLASNIALITNGAGKYSLDAMWRKK